MVSALGSILTSFPKKCCFSKNNHFVVGFFEVVGFQYDPTTGVVSLSSTKAFHPSSSQFSLLTHLKKHPLFLSYATLSMIHHGKCPSEYPPTEHDPAPEFFSEGIHIASEHILLHPAGTVLYNFSVLIVQTLLFFRSPYFPRTKHYFPNAKKTLQNNTNQIDTTKTPSLELIAWLRWWSETSHFFLLPKHNTTQRGALGQLRLSPTKEKSQKNTAWVTDSGLFTGSSPVDRGGGVDADIFFGALDQKGQVSQRGGGIKRGSW